MHISFMVPMWALIGFGTIAYPSLGAIISSFLARASNRRMPGWLLGVTGTFWPVALGLGVAAFPAWLVVWLVIKYGGAISTMLQGKGGTVNTIVADGKYTIGKSVQMIGQVGDVASGWGGRIEDQKPGFLYINFGMHKFWVPEDSVRLA